jgi:peptidoglycan hydrolase-like protein with peptidoglycan-binding domain
MSKNNHRTFIFSVALMALMLFGATFNTFAAQTPAAPPAKAARKAKPESDYGKVQIKLREMGLYKGEITGYKNPETIEALRQYQQKNGLKVTGTLSAETRAKFGLPERKPRKKTGDMAANQSGQ